LRVCTLWNPLHSQVRFILSVTKAHDGLKISSLRFRIVGRRSCVMAC
jgi:hypothetical protein